MFGSRRRKSSNAERVFRVPDGMRVYAIGDVHGCRRQLDSLLDRIDRDSDGCGLDVQLVFLGDYVDRGPDSKAVLDRLASGDLPAASRFLMGNHEEAMLSVLDGYTDLLSGWLNFGGLQTLASYGLSRSEIFKPGADLPKRMREIIPASHVEFLRGLEQFVRTGDYLFVHAGIRPGVPIERQEASDLRWIRSEFLEDSSDHGMMIVHGHTISEGPQVRANRIGIDTGCFASGVLTALVLEGTERRFLQS